MPHRTPSRRPARRILPRLCCAIGTVGLAVTLAAAAGAGAPAWAADSFYTGLLRDGILAYDRGAFGDAARDLRLACFGLLDEPETLAVCLVRLAVAQGAAGDAEGFQATFRRVVEIEERFGAYAKADLPPAVRAAFEERVGKAIPAATLAAVPAFQRLARKPDTPPSGRQTREPRPATPPPAPAPSVTEPGRPAAEAPGRPAGAEERREAGAAPAAGGPAASATPPAPVAVVSAAPPAAVPRPLTAAERQTLDEARRLLAQADGKGLRQALQLAGEVAGAHPEDRAAQHLAAEAAYRNARWEEAATFFRRGGDPGDEKPELLFYMAVTLFEKGDPQAAAAALRRALPNLERTPYVDSYARRILGS